MKKLVLTDRDLVGKKVLSKRQLLQYRFQHTLDDRSKGMTLRQEETYKDLLSHAIVSPDESDHPEDDFKTLILGTGDPNGLTVKIVIQPTGELEKVYL